jgi:MFS family permease
MRSARKGLVFLEETQEIIGRPAASAEEKKRGFFKNFNSDRDFNLFLIAGFMGGIGAGIYSSVFNNFLSDVYKLSADARGVVEVPRELPGVFIMFVLGLLNFLGDIRIALFGTIAAALGMLGLGLLSPTFGLMLVWMMFFSLGQHMVFPVTPTIGMELSKKEEYGTRLGRVSAYTLSGTIVAFLFIWLGFRFLNLSYQASFIIAAVFNVLSAVALALMKPRKPEQRRVKFVFRKRYTLYYILCIVNGARKQIFMTFAPWVLIQIFGLEASQFAVLGIVVAVVSIMTRKIVGRTIDIKGERFILSLEAVILFVICIGYAFAGDVFSAGVAMVIIAACYVIDNSMNAVEMARSTYVRKIAIDPADVTPTLSTGTSIDHVVSMSMPYFGGLLWAFAGYKYVFIAAGVIALLNLILSRKIET